MCGNITSKLFLLVFRCPLILFIFVFGIKPILTALLFLVQLQDYTINGTPIEAPDVTHNITEMSYYDKCFSLWPGGGSSLQSNESTSIAHYCKFFTVFLLFVVILILSCCLCFCFKKRRRRKNIRDYFIGDNNDVASAELLNDIPADITRKNENDCYVLPLAPVNSSDEASSHNNPVASILINDWVQTNNKTRDGIQKFVNKQKCRYCNRKTTKSDPTYFYILTECCNCILCEACFTKKVEDKVITHCPNCKAKCLNVMKTTLSQAFSSVNRI